MNPTGSFLFVLPIDRGPCRRRGCGHPELSCHVHGYNGAAYCGACGRTACRAYLPPRPPWLRALLGSTGPPRHDAGHRVQGRVPRPLLLALGALLGALAALAEAGVLLRW